MAEFSNTLRAPPGCISETLKSRASSLWAGTAFHIYDTGTKEEAENKWKLAKGVDVLLYLIS